MAHIELDGRTIDAPVTDIGLQEIGFGADRVMFKIGDVEVSMPIVELLEVHDRVKRGAPLQNA